MSLKSMILAAVAAVSVTPAAAQMSVDFSMVGSSVAGITTPVVLNPCPGGRCPGAGVSSRGGRYAQQGYRSVQSGPVDTSYRPTPALAREALSGYISRVRRSDPQAADMAAEQFRKHDYGRIYAGIVRPFGYRSDNLADSLAAYSLLSWLIATGSPDPTPAQAQAVRRQVALRLAQSPQLTAPRTRAELGEEMKLLFVTLHAGWQSARREGNLRQYGDGVARMIARQGGQDLRELRLTGSEGFVER